MSEAIDWSRKVYVLHETGEHLPTRVNATLTGRGSPFQVFYEGQWRRVWWQGDDTDRINVANRRIPVRPINKEPTNDR